MNVSELITELQALNPELDLPVRFQYTEQSGCCSNYSEDYTDEEVNTVVLGVYVVQKNLPGPRGGPTKLRTVAEPAIILGEF